MGVIVVFMVLLINKNIQEIILNDLTLTDCSKQEKNGVAIGELSYIPQMSRILDDNGDYLPMIKNDYDDQENME